MILLFSIAIVFIVFLILRPYILAHDTLTLFTGGNGSGKSLFSVRESLRLLRRLRLKVFLHNINEHMNIFSYIKRFFNGKSKNIWEKPLLYSTIPIRISRKEWSKPLKIEHLMLQERLPLRCVVFIDEINLLISQMDYKCKGEKALNEFVTLFRHYTCGGFLVANTQNLNKVHWIFRYCFNEAINLSECKKIPFFFPLIFSSKVRKITLGDDIKAIEVDDATKNKQRMYCLRSFRKHYDTFCFSERAKNVPFGEFEHYLGYKVNKFTHVDCSVPYIAKTEG